MNIPLSRVLMDNGGRRRLKDRRHLPAVAFGRERRSNWKRRSGLDRRRRREFSYGAERRSHDPIDPIVA